MPKMVSSHVEHMGWIFDPLMPRCFSLAGDLQSVRFPTQWWSPKSTEASPPQSAGSLQFCCKLLCFMVIASDFLITTRRVAEASLCTWSWSCQRKPSPDLWQNRPRLYTSLHPKYQAGKTHNIWRSRNCRNFSPLWHWFTCLSFWMSVLCHVTGWMFRSHPQTTKESWIWGECLLLFWSQPSNKSWLSVLWDWGASHAMTPWEADRRKCWQLRVDCFRRKINVQKSSGIVPYVFPWGSQGKLFDHCRWHSSMVIVPKKSQLGV